MVPENIRYSRKIRIYPDTEQKILLNKCFGTSRFLYNCALNLVKEKQLKNEEIIWNLPWFRKLLIPKEKDLPIELQWMKEIPYDTRAMAIRDLIYAYTSNFELLKKGYITNFEIKPKTKKHKTQICHIDHRALKIDRKLFTTRLKKNLRVRSKTKKWWTKNIKKIDSESLISKENGRYYLILSLEKKQDVSKTNRDPIVALDPGVRTFQSFYSPTGKSGKIGDGTSLKLNKLGSKIDKLTSISTKIGDSKTRANLKRRCSVLRTKIRNSIKDLHCKSASFLCNNWDNIVISEFEIKNMIPRRLRKLKSKTVRQMLSLSHYKFRQRLIFKGKLLNNRIIIWNEAYTTKTCGNCGNIKEIGSNKIYDCNKCGIITDRDIGAARTFLIRYFTELNALRNKCIGLDPTHQSCLSIKAI